MPSSAAGVDRRSFGAGARARLWAGLAAVLVGLAMLAVGARAGAEQPAKPAATVSASAAPTAAPAKVGAKATGANGTGAAQGNGAAKKVGPEEKRYVYVTTFSADKDQATATLFDRIDTAIMSGLRLAGSREEAVRRYDDELSYRRIQDELPETVRASHEFTKYTSSDLDREIDAARKKIKGTPKSLEILKPRVFRTSQGQLRIDLERYKREGMELLEVKSVGGCGEGEEEVLERLRQAAERLGTAEYDQEPIAVISASPGGSVAMGTAVTLQGCRSADPDHDAMAWTWRQINAPTDGSGMELVVLPKSGLPGREMTFTPELPGTYVFQLELKQILGRKNHSVTRAVEVVAPPRAVPGASRLVEKVGETVLLDGNGSTPLGSVSGRWRQIAGPRVHIGDVWRWVEDNARGLPVDAVESILPPDLVPERSGNGLSTVSTECASLRCAFKPDQTGLYTFELEVRDGPFSDRAQVSILVAPPPRVRIGDVRSIEAGSGYMTPIDGSASQDVLDEHPTFQWEVIEGPERAAVTPNNQPKVMFVGEALGKYTVQLRVCARRHLPGQELWSCETDEADVIVRRHWVMLFANLGYTGAAGQEPTGFDRALSANAGIVVQPFGNYRPALSAVALRFSHSLARVSAAPEGTSGLPAGTTEWGGASTWEVGYWFFAPGIAELLPRAGLHISLVDPSQRGLNVGATFALRIWHRVFGLIDTDYSHVWYPATRAAGGEERQSDLFSVRGGFGVRL